MRKTNYKCYLCDEIATTKEHVPAKCFFPKQKHLPSGSRNYRKNLITVPSCEKHNNQRSKDDEYTAVSIILHAESDIAFNLLKSKWIKAMCRQNASLGNLMFARSKPVVIPYLHGDLLVPKETMAMTYDRQRIDNVIKSIACGLYYYESGYKNKWLKDWDITSPNFLMPNLSRSPYYRDLINLARGFDLAKLERKGEHREIFYYQIRKHDDDNKWTIKMVFYESMIFVAIPKPY
ncbi:MAG: hypothetical protein SWZ49_13635 [Cyanobacteriota bacterium]|nr:hypothetical protein [Cyanobacteriota bacterium]